jgi:cyclopropane-fatty-acyl-phospholipid synthase
LTLSIEQKVLAEKRIAAAGFSENISIMLMDYQTLPITKTPYDKVISIEMLEAVGREYL